MHRRLQAIYDYALGSSKPPVLCLSDHCSTLSFPSSSTWLVSVSCSNAPQPVSGPGPHHLQGPFQVQVSLNNLLSCEQSFLHGVHPFPGQASLPGFLPGSWQEALQYLCPLHRVRGIELSHDGSAGTCGVWSPASLKTPLFPVSQAEGSGGASGEPTSGHRSGPAASEGAEEGGAREHRGLCAVLADWPSPDVATGHGSNRKMGNRSWCLHKE